MADLIDRAALGIGKANPLAFDKPEYADGWNSAVEIIQKAPSVDAVEVVRCKDCKKSGMYAFGHDATERLACLDIDDFGWVHMATSVEPMDFCSYGERRKDANN